jgi:VIT1/CCC1 family predicted Fe2+/Mn2+ transporter
MDTHLHHEQHFKSSDTLRDIVIGMADGLTVPFALAAGLSGAVASNKIILTAGIAEIVAGSIAMGLGGYLAGKTEVDHYNSELKREYEETYLYPEREKEEVREVFAEYGLSEEHQQIVVEALAKDRDKWVDFMMRFELGLEKPDPDRARQSALNIGGAYIVGGLIPLSTYWFFDETPVSFRWSVIITLVALMIFGYFKNKIIGQNPISGAFRTALIGAAAAGTAYLVASWLG